MLRRLAERPHTLTELDQRISVFGYRKLERICRELIEVGLVEREALGGRVTSYGVTDWGRLAAGPLAAAMRWERWEIPAESAPVTEIEAECVLLLGAPLVEVSEAPSGHCALLVDSDGSLPESLGGAVIHLVDGRPLSWEAVAPSDAEALQPEVDCWVRGPTSAWLATPTRGGMAALLRTGGDTGLAERVLVALRDVGSLRSRVRIFGTTSSDYRY